MGVPRPSLFPLILVAVGFAVGCGTLRAYPGPPLPGGQVATLQPALDWEAEIRIDEVDGRPLGWWRSRAELMPGEHTVQATVMMRGAGARGAVATHELQLAAQAGHAYEVHGDYHLYGPRVWIYDRTAAVTVTLAEVRPARLPPVAAGRPD
jgi:hypothetical protein